MRSLAVMMLAGCAAASETRSAGKLVAVLPDGVDPWWFTVSRDGSTAAYVERTSAGAWLFVGARRYGPYT